MSNTVQFTSASNFIAASAPSFAAVPIKYFLAAYCPALDPYVTAAEDIPDLETIFPTSAVDIPEGVEVLYNLGALSSFYQLSNDKVLYYTIGQSGVNTISGSDFNDVDKVNLLSGHPLSTIVSGTSFVYEDGVWTVGAPDEITGINTVPSGYPNSRDKFYSDVSFAPVTSGAEVRGLYKMKMGKSTGTFKYNLLIPYVTRFIDSTTEDTSIEPVMFAVLKLNYPITKSTVDGDGNFSNTEHDLSISFSSAISGAQNHFFLDGGYWLYNGLTNSVSWDGDVVINTSAVPGSWVPDAKLTVINTNASKAIFKATYGDDQTKRYFSVTGAAALDDTVYSRDVATILYRSANDLAPTSFVKHVVDGSYRRATTYLANDNIMIRGGKPDTGASYLTAGVSGNSIQIISGGLNSKVIIGATSGHDQLLSTKYGSLADDALLSIYGDVNVSGETVTSTVTTNTLRFGGVGGASIFEDHPGLVIRSFDDITGIAIADSGAVTTPVSLTTPVLNVGTSATINNPTFTGSSIEFSGNVNFNGTTNIYNGNYVAASLFIGTDATITNLNATNATIPTASVTNLDATNLNGTTNFNVLAGNNIQAASATISGLLTVNGSGLFASLIATNSTISNLTSLTVGSGTTMSKIVTGRTALNGTAISISSTSVTSGSIILVTAEDSGANPAVKISARDPGVGFSVTCSPGINGHINWIIINP